MTISSTTAARHGISSSTSLGGSCPLVCANGRTSSDQRELVLGAGWPTRSPVRGDVQSMVTPLALIGADHLSISSATNLAKYAGPLRSLLRPLADATGDVAVSD